MNQGYNAYKTANIDTADKGKLLVICYDVAIKHGSIAVDLAAADYKNIEEKNKHLRRMSDAISELITSLNFEAGGEIATNLYRLYEYMQYRIGQAIVHNDSQPIREIIGYLTELREAWKVAAQNVRTSASGNQTST